jgi:hypothetical protein
MSRFIRILFTGLFGLSLTPFAMTQTAQYSPPSASGTREICMFVFQNDEGKSDTLFLPTLRVMQLTESSEQFKLPEGAPAKINNITCFRNPASIVPEDNDYKVAVAGYRLVLIERETKRTAYLEIKNGELAYRVVRGELSESELEKLKAVMKVAKIPSPSAPASKTEQSNAAILRTFKQAPPACESGHADALVDGKLTIKVGDTICLRVKQNGNEIEPLSVATSATDGDTIVLKFWQIAETKGMALQVYSPFDKLFRYQALMLLPGESNYRATSTCSVLAKLSSIEQWDHPIKELKLANFKLLPDAKTVECK